MKKIYLILISSVLIFTGCQFKANNQTTTQQTNTQTTSEDKFSSQMLVGSTVVSKAGQLQQDSKNDTITKIKEKVKSLVANKTENLTYKFNYSPIVKAFIVSIVAPGTEQDPMYKSIFLFDETSLTSERLFESILVDNQYSNLASDPVFSADGLSEVAWVEYDKTVDVYPRKLNVYNIRSKATVKYTLAAPSIFKGYDLVVTPEALLFRTDRQPNPFNTAVFTKATRVPSITELKPVPAILLDDLITTLNLKDKQVKFEKVLGTTTNGETVIFALSYTEEEKNKFAIVSTPLNNFKNAKIVTSEFADNLYVSNQVVGQNKVIYLTKGKEAELTLSELSLDAGATNKLVQIKLKSNNTDLTRIA